MPLYLWAYLLRRCEEEGEGETDVFACDTRARCYELGKVDSRLRGRPPHCVSRYHGDEDEKEKEEVLNYVRSFFLVS